ncbi:hypothetical protein Acr_00g0005020 [Actinidia rufa]|uniref:Uncharacterized protein n=1 Tax=Actinidia rufa TaxID=165716 RepID=A0A7J0D906_9ERIC|nr:hypothetical protein Acr_00g0005020 [Actinidia rufa]
MSSEVIVDNLENSLPSWRSDQLGERSYIETIVIEYPSLPREDSFENEEGLLVDVRPPPEREMDIMTQSQWHLAEEIMPRTKTLARWPTLQLMRVSLAIPEDEMPQAQQIAKNLENRVAKLEADKQHSNAAMSTTRKELEKLKKYKEEFDVAMEKHEKEMAKMRRKVVRAKKLAVDECKASEEYKKAV